MTCFGYGVDTSRARRPLWTSGGVDVLSAEALMKALGVIAIGEAEADVPNVVALKFMASRAQRQVLGAAEVVNGCVVRASRDFCAERDLVRPLAIDRRLAQLAFAIDHCDAPRVRTDRQSHDSKQVSLGLD
jgi:hypothetical protein